MKLRARRGAALALALFAVVAVAALAHAALAPALAHRRAATRLAAFQWAETLAERSVAGVVRDRPPEWWRALAVGATRADDPPVGAPPAAPAGAGARVAVTRLSPTAFLLRADASVPAAGVPATAHRVLFLELRADSVHPAPAVTLGGDLTARPADIIAVDHACASDSAHVPAVMVAPSSAVSWGGEADDASVARDSAAVRAGTYARPGGLDLGALREAADVHLPAGASVGPMPTAEGERCVIGAGHWGEPLRGGDAVAVCLAAYPVVAAEGDLLISSGRGQGVLLVGGRLRITGPFHFSGLVVASGGIETDGDDVTVHGMVLAGPSTGVAFRAARTTVRASSCVLRDLAASHAVLSTAPARPWGR